MNYGYWVFGVTFFTNAINNLDLCILTLEKKKRNKKVFLEVINSLFLRVICEENFLEMAP